MSANYTANEKKAKIREVVKKTCRKNNIKIEELYYGGRRRNVLFWRGFSPKAFGASLFMQRLGTLNRKRGGWEAMLDVLKSQKVRHKI